MKKIFLLIFMVLLASCSPFSETQVAGSAVSYSGVWDNPTLDFEFKDGRIFDMQTGSEWKIINQAIA